MWALPMRLARVFYPILTDCVFLPFFSLSSSSSFLIRGRREEDLTVGIPP